jgi:hypothetical protein
MNDRIKAAQEKLSTVRCLMELLEEKIKSAQEDVIIVCCEWLNIKICTDINIS